MNSLKTLLPMMICLLAVETAVSQTYEGTFNFGFMDDSSREARPVRFSITVDYDYKSVYVLESRGSVIEHGTITTDGFGTFETSLANIRIDSSGTAGTVERDGIRDNIYNLRMTDPGPIRDEKNLESPPQEFQMWSYVRIASDDPNQRYGYIHGTARGGRVLVLTSDNKTRYIHYSQLEPAQEEVNGFRTGEWVSTPNGKRRIIALFADGEVLTSAYVDTPRLEQIIQEKFSAREYQKSVTRRIGATLARGWRSIFPQAESADSTQNGSDINTAVSCDQVFRAPK